MEQPTEKHAEKRQKTIVLLIFQLHRSATSRAPQFNHGHTAVHFSTHCGTIFAYFQRTNEEIKKGDFSEQSSPIFQWLRDTAP